MPLQKSVRDALLSRLKRNAFDVTPSGMTKREAEAWARETALEMLAVAERRLEWLERGLIGSNGKLKQ